MKKIPVVLYNTLTRKKDVFKPIKEKTVGLYSCGPTVYLHAHIGNMRAYLFVDFLRRTLEYNGFKVKHVMNITDVGHLFGDEDDGKDKMEESAKREKKNIWDVAKHYTDLFLKDIDSLNILRANILPRATDHIKDQIELIKTLEKKGYTYRISDGIYFDTSKLKEYGKLARLNLKGLKEGARVKKNIEKKNPTDFALWKFSPKDKKRQMEWDSPWGIGFPGWHIECSTMSTKYLGQPFDIHTGGIDHIPVHHVNEIAQSEAAYDKPLANFWMHNAFLNLKNGKMSKSEGKILVLDDLIKMGFSALDFRYLVLTSHYRSELKFSKESMIAAHNTFNRLKEYVIELKKTAKNKINNENIEKFKEMFLKAINTDLNTPEALSVLWKVIRSNLNTEEKLILIEDFDQVLGLGLKDLKNESKIPKEIEKVVKKREIARKGKKWAEADKLRNLILEKGFIVEDRKSGPMIKKA